MCQAAGNQIYTALILLQNGQQIGFILLHK